MTRSAPLENLLSQLLNETHRSELGWQFAILVVCGLASWGLMRWVCPRLTQVHGTWRFGLEGLQRIGLPLVALALVLMTGGSGDMAAGACVELVVPLLGAMVLVRTLVYMLRYVHCVATRPFKTWERLIAWTIWIGLALHITGVLPRILRALDTVAFDAGTHHFSLLLLLEAIIVIVLAVDRCAVAGAIRRDAPDARVPAGSQSASGADQSDAHLAADYVACLFALPAVGIDITVLSVFGGALGVGLGLGLQKIASNYVSGFIILLDRSIRPGDMLTVGTGYGEVSQINTRYTLLKALDGTEILIPNETLITSTISESLAQQTRYPHGDPDPDQLREPAGAGNGDIDGSGEQPSARVAG